MKKITTRLQFTFLILWGLFVTMHAQNRSIDIRCERDGMKGYRFLYNKNTEGTYSVFIKLNDAFNLSPTEYTGITNGFAGTLFSADAIERDANFGFSSCQSSYLRGKLNPKIDSTYLYALPFKKGVTVLVLNLCDLREKFFGETPTRKMKAFEFRSLKNDTVSAIRKGIVVSIVDKFEMDTTVAKSYTGNTNSILIEQPDGTLASYSGFKKGCIFVKEGQTVFPFTPLGCLAHYDIAKEYQLRLSVSFLAEINSNNPNENLQVLRNKRFYEYLNPYFLTDKGVCQLQEAKKYTVEYSGYVAECEMTKKELKTIGKKHKTENDLSLIIDRKHQIAKDTVYLDELGNEQDSKENAFAFSVRWSDSTNDHRKIIKTFYPSGDLKEEFFQIDNPTPEGRQKAHWYYKEKNTGHTWFIDGMRKTWYPNGQLKREVQFAEGRISGIIRTYWENGKIKRTNLDSLGNLIPTKCFDINGKDVPVYPFSSTGEFDNGKSTVDDYLNKNIIYPREALDKLIEGSVLISFSITQDGSVTNCKTIKSDHPLLDAEVKRVLESMPKWKPGTYDGELVPYSASARYRFKLPTVKTDWLAKLNRQDTIFYDNTGRTICSKNYSTCYVVLSPDSSNRNKAIERVYSKTGQLLSEKYFLQSDLTKPTTGLQNDTQDPSTLFSEKEWNCMKLKTEGKYREWYENGQLSKDFYVENGKKDGNLNFYWQDGKPRRIDVYRKGELISSLCYDKVGNQIPYFEVDTPATFPGGSEAMDKYIRMNLENNVLATKNNPPTQAIVSFVVDKTGKTTRISVTHCRDKNFGALAFRIVSNMPQWHPEFRNGEPILSMQSISIPYLQK